MEQVTVITRDDKGIKTKLLTSGECIKMLTRLARKRTPDGSSGYILIDHIKGEVTISQDSFSPHHIGMESLSRLGKEWDVRWVV